MEDNRFKEVPSLRKKDVPHQLHWFLKEDYFSDELLGLYHSEVDLFKTICTEGFQLFQQATDKILKEKQLHLLGIPEFFQKCIYYTWEKKDIHPFLLGRFDVNGGIGNSISKIIEFNADTCSTLAESIYWQPTQFQQLKGSYKQFNETESHLESRLRSISKQINSTPPVMLGSSLGFPEDVINTKAMLDIAHKAGYETYYLDLEHVVFSGEGIFYNVNDDEYIKADLWYKLIPWDWIYNEEPELGKILAYIILNDLGVVVNPPYTTIWQNKAFLSYITQHFPNNIIAETFNDLTWSMPSHVRKPVYGRIGENILLKDETGKEVKTNGDFAGQKMVYQKYYPLPCDLERYYYQVGVFFSEQACGLNLRTQNSQIINDECEFMSHFIF